MIKKIIVFILLPVYSIGQTAHIEDDKIFYSGTLATKTVNLTDLNSEIKNVVEKNNGKISIKDSTTKVELKLSTPFTMIRKLTFRVTTESTNSGLNYEFSDFEILEAVRGEKLDTIPSKDVVKNMGESGNPSIEAEKILNEIDMRIQQLLALLRNNLALK